MATGKQELGRALTGARVNEMNSKTLAWVGGPALLVGVFFLGGAILGGVWVNPWDVGLAGSALGLILLAIFVPARRAEKRHKEMLAALEAFGLGIDEAAENAAIHVADQFRQMRQTVLFTAGVRRSVISKFAKESTTNRNT